MDEKTFMDDLYRAFDDRAQVILNRIDSRDWDVLVGVIESTDRVQHMMWRLMDPKHPDVRRRRSRRSSATRSSGSTAAPISSSARCSTHIEPGTPVLIVSDHGFHSWRKAVNLNTWLVQQGYMALQGQQPGEKKLDDLFGGGEFWENVDWSRTRAYAMGIGQIYFNLRGREGKGIVSPGAEAAELADELSEKLLTLTDPDDGASIVRAVYKRDDIYSGEYLSNAAELQVGHGGRLSRLVADDARRIAAGHRVPEHEEVERRSRRLRLRDDRGRVDLEPSDRGRGAAGVSDLSIMDIAPTVLKYFGLPIPGDIDGKPLF